MYEACKHHNDLLKEFDQMRYLKEFDQMGYEVGKVNLTGHDIAMGIQITTFTSLLTCSSSSVCQVKPKET